MAHPGRLPRPPRIFITVGAPPGKSPLKRCCAASFAHQRCKEVLIAPLTAFILTLLILTMVNQQAFAATLVGVRFITPPRSSNSTAFAPSSNYDTSCNDSNNQPIMHPSLSNNQPVGPHFIAPLGLSNSIAHPKLSDYEIPPTKLTRGVVLSSEVTYTNAGPELVSMLNINLTSPNIHIGVVQAHNRLISPDETLTSMANRTKAMAGINGDYFDIHSAGVPIGEEVINGHLLHGPNPDCYSVLGVTSAGRLTIGTEVFTSAVIDGNSSYRLFSINHYSEYYDGRLLMFTPDLGKPAYVGGDPVAIIRPVAKSSDTFIVKSVQSSVTWLSVPSKEYALLGSGDAGSWLTNTLQPGDRIKLPMHISPDPNLVQAVGGGPIVLHNGAIYSDPYTPNPRAIYRHNPLTAVGVSKNGKHALFAVFDGSFADPVGSRGMTYFEAAQFMLDHGSYNAMLFDGGGSSQMVARRPGHSSAAVINWPSDGYERPVANGLFIYSTGFRARTLFPPRPRHDVPSLSTTDEH